MEGLDADDELKKAAEAAANPEPVAGDKRKRSTTDFQSGNVDPSPDKYTILMRSLHRGAPLRALPTSSE
jgi:hypothetical protein